MKTTVSRHDFHRAFETIRPDNFSYDGLDALYDWCEEYDEGSGQEMELDVIALCCDFSEGDSALAWIKDHGYGFEPDEDKDEDEREEEALEYLYDHTTVIVFDGGVIVQGF